MIKYRILGRKTKDFWAPFGVAYERGGKIFLFVPAWHAPRILEVQSLNALGQVHFPSKAFEYRWERIQEIPNDIPHPIAFLERIGEKVGLDRVAAAGSEDLNILRIDCPNYTITLRSSLDEKNRTLVSLEVKDEHRKELERKQVRIKAKDGEIILTGTIVSAEVSNVVSRQLKDIKLPLWVVINS